MTDIVDYIIDKISDEQIKGNEPILILLHPKDFLNLSKELEEKYGWGRMAMTYLQTFFGLPVIITQRIEEGKALVVPKGTFEILIDIYMKHFKLAMEDFERCTK